MQEKEKGIAPAVLFKWGEQMKFPTWDKPVFRPEHVIRESDEEFWIDDKKIRGVVDNSVTVEKFGENSIVTLSIIVKEYERF